MIYCFTNCLLIVIKPAVAFIVYTPALRDETFTSTALFEVLERMVFRIAPLLDTTDIIKSLFCGKPLPETNTVLPAGLGNTSKLDDAGVPELFIKFDGLFSLTVDATTDTVTFDDVVTAPLSSVAFAVSVYVPAGTFIQE